MSLPEVMRLHRELDNIKNMRLRWVQHLTEEFFHGWQDTNTKYEEWNLRAASLCSSMIFRDPSGAQAVKEIEALVYSQRDFNTAVFQMRIPIGDPYSVFQLEGQIVAKTDQQQRSTSYGPQTQIPSSSHIHDIKVTAPFPHSALKLSSAKDQKLWIKWSASGCFCITCPCPPIVAPSSNAIATHCLVPRHFHLDPLEHDRALTHFYTVHREIFVNTQEMLLKYGLPVTLDTGKPLDDLDTVNLHNREVGCWYEDASNVLRSHHVETSVNKTIRAATLPHTIFTISWPPTFQDRKWAIICPIPDCTTTVIPRESFQQTDISQHFQMHGMQVDGVSQAIQLFGYRVIDDPINRVIQREPRPTPEGISHLPAVETNDAPSPTLPDATKEILDRRIKYRYKDWPQVEYLSGRQWISRSQWWVRREEQIYLEYDKTHPFKAEDARILERSDSIDKLRQKCRNAGVGFNPRMTIKGLEKALKRTTAIGSAPQLE